MKDPRWLLGFRSDVYSQTGEDGVIAKVLATLPKADRWCVEFGAWDGEYLSNVCNLIDNQGYAGVLIEGSATKFQELRKRYAANSKVTPLNKMVGFGKEDNLDEILKGTPIPLDFDFLSIDIDGNDYHVWKAVSRYRPKVVCIEFNPTVPTEVRWVQPADARLNRGASLLALVELAKKKAYELVCVLPWNAIFVRGEYFPLFEISDNRPKSLRADLTAVTYFFSGYDGAILLAGAQRLPWHGLEFREADLQILPRMLRRYPLDYSWAQQRLFWLFKQFTGLRTHTRRLFRLFWRLAGLRKRARNIRDGRS